MHIELDFTKVAGPRYTRRLHIGWRTLTHEYFDPRFDRWVIDPSFVRRDADSRPPAGRHVRRETVERAIGPGRAEEPGETVGVFPIDPLHADDERALRLVEMIRETQELARSKIEESIADTAIGGMGDAIDYGIDMGHQGDAAYKTLGAPWNELRTKQLHQMQWNEENERRNEARQQRFSR
ncbi:hypothetical protein HJD18_12410 [Thermoleophilia bacterium SCSIO 60948]|nr:hypothetical protein HJD18_12410 [Thermoleophilia bacterium SCSIO 60948]